LSWRVVAGVTLASFLLLWSWFLWLARAQENPKADAKTPVPSQPSSNGLVPMDELLLILNPAKTGRTAISVQSYSLELTWEQLPVISEQVD